MTKVNQPIPDIYVITSGTNSLYVSVGAAGAVSTSTSYTNWILRNTGITNNLACIACGNNRFVAAGSAGGIFVSGSTIPSLAVENQSPSGVQLTLSGGLGPTYHLQASTNLSTWTNLVVFTNIGAGVSYTDTNSNNFQRRYYRTVSP